VYQFLKPGGICALLIADVRKDGELIPLGFRLMQEFLQSDFHLKDTIVKIQNKERVTKQFWTGKVNSPDYLIAHEYLFLFKKKKEKSRS
jgi:hypothetical protein